ncbi:MAG: transposase [Verrucomicrobia bacterium]|nr:MAG: transposase [Verrucomicrobiota bacterium]
MARKLRIEYQGALYHVLNRGNYRRDVFERAGEAIAFTGALEEATKLFSWRIHAYVVMRNHYHLALETPEPNLVDGMHWLQSTFATRFNRFRQENGHLFQGRYQSLLVEDDAALSRLVNYIHLNPVRSGMVASEDAASFRWGSLGRFVRGPRFEGLEAERWLSALGLSDGSEDWVEYLEMLHGLAHNAEAQEQAGFSCMSQGWAIGTTGWRRSIAQEHAEKALQPGLSAADARSLREAHWADTLSQLLAEAGKTEKDAEKARKSVPWKVKIAFELRRQSGAAVRWIAEALFMGSPDAVRGYLHKYAKDRNLKN